MKKLVMGAVTVLGTSAMVWTGGDAVSRIRENVSEMSQAIVTMGEEMEGMVSHHNTSQSELIQERDELGQQLQDARWEAARLYELLQQADDSTIQAELNEEISRLYQQLAVMEGENLRLAGELFEANRLVAELDNQVEHYRNIAMDVFENRPTIEDMN